MTQNTMSVILDVIKESIKKIKEFPLGGDSFTVEYFSLHNDSSASKKYFILCSFDEDSPILKQYNGYIDFINYVEKVFISLIYVEDLKGWEYVIEFSRGNNSFSSRNLGIILDLYRIAVDKDNLIKNIEE